MRLSYESFLWFETMQCLVTTFYHIRCIFYKHGNKHGRSNKSFQFSVLGKEIPKIYDAKRREPNEVISLQSRVLVYRARGKV